MTARLRTLLLLAGLAVATAAVAAARAAMGEVGEGPWARLVLPRLPCTVRSGMFGLTVFSRDRM